MYKINIDKDYNSEPWNVDAIKRFSSVLNELKWGKKISITLYDEPDTSTFRYRGYNIMQYSKLSEKWHSDYFFASELEYVYDLLDKISNIKITRMKWTNQLNNLIAVAKSKGVKILFDVDDRVFDVEYLPILANSLSLNFENESTRDIWFANVARIGLSASLADGFITTNDFLGRALEQKYNKPYKCIINSLNKEQIEISEKLCQIKKLSEKNGKFTIGYFSGSPSHKQDFLVVHKEIEKILEKYTQIELVVVGFMEFPPYFQKYLDNGQIRFIPLVDFIELQKLVAEVDLNIVPLEVNDFTNCKSELKFFEAAIVDTVTIAAPIFTYSNIIRNEENGFICNPGEWFETIENIFLNKYDLKSIILEAKKDSITKYSGINFINQIEEAYNFFDEL